jgi:nicotinate-nucleotide adenylyltransferase
MPVAFIPFSQYMVTLSVRNVSIRHVAVKEHQLKAKKRIGIFAGSFDPVHAGHLAFALQAIKEANLDQVYFLPERHPRNKPDVEHFGHRTAMLSRAIRPHRHLGLFELPDSYFNVKRTLPKLRKEFAGAQLVFLMGSDAVLRLNLDNWPGKDLEKFLARDGLVVGLRSEQNIAAVAAALAALPQKPQSLHLIKLSSENISSSRIRQAFRHGLPAAGLLMSVGRYAKANWLYVSVSAE